jgi:hypothetical protein
MIKNNKNARDILLSNEWKVYSLMPSLLKEVIKNDDSDLLNLILSYPRLVEWQTIARPLSKYYIFSASDFERLITSVFKLESANDQSKSKDVLFHYCLQNLNHLPIEQATPILWFMKHYAVLHFDLETCAKLETFEQNQNFIPITIFIHTFSLAYLAEYVDILDRYMALDVPLQEILNNPKHLFQYPILSSQHTHAFFYAFLQIIPDPGREHIFKWFLIDAATVIDENILNVFVQNDEFREWVVNNLQTSASANAFYANIRSEYILFTLLHIPQFRSWFTSNIDAIFLQSVKGRREYVVEIISSDDTLAEKISPATLTECFFYSKSWNSKTKQAIESSMGIKKTMADASKFHSRLTSTDSFPHKDLRQEHDRKIYYFLIIHELLTKSEEKRFIYSDLPEDAITEKELLHLWQLTTDHTEIMSYFVKSSYLRARLMKFFKSSTFEVRKKYRVQLEMLFNIINSLEDEEFVKLLLPLSIGVVDEAVLMDQVYLSVFEERHGLEHYYRQNKQLWEYFNSRDIRYPTRMVETLQKFPNDIIISIIQRFGLDNLATLFKKEHSYRHFLY